MSRSGYNDDCDGWVLIRWRGQVASAIRGARGQKLLRELADALDAMPEKKLIANDLEANGCYCALGVVGNARGIDLAKLDPEDARGVGEAFDIAVPLAREIVFENDEGVWYDETPERRWQRMREWVRQHLILAPNTGGKP